MKKFLMVGIMPVCLLSMDRQAVVNRLSPYDTRYRELTVGILWNMRVLNAVGAEKMQQIRQEMKPLLADAPSIASHCFQNNPRGIYSTHDLAKIEAMYEEFFTKSDAILEKHHLRKDPFNVNQPLVSHQPDISCL